MKRVTKMLFCAAMCLVSTTQAYADDPLMQLFGGLAGGNKTEQSGDNSQSSALGDLLGGLASSLQGGDATQESIAGQWEMTGPAVVLQSSEGGLTNAGGAAIAGVAENKLLPYYQKLGVDSLSIDIDKDGAFEMTLKGGKKIKGNLVKKTEKDAEANAFSLTFAKDESSKLGKLTSMTIYAQQSLTSLTLTIDVSKLVSAVEKVASSVDIASLKSITSLVSSYDNVRLGIRLKKQQDNQ